MAPLRRPHSIRHSRMLRELANDWTHRLEYGAKDAAEALADRIFARLPQAHPSAERLRNAKLIAHRGAWGATQRGSAAVAAAVAAGTLENTLAAFRAAIDAGCWGIEFDVQWTKDLVPVIHHDSSTKRLFAHNLIIRESAFADVRRLMPLIPTLEEVLSLAGGHIHLMIEIKKRPDGFSDAHVASLRAVLAGLQPIRDWHTIALDPAILDTFSWVPREACLTVAELNTGALSRAALDKGYGGVTGHYALLTSKIVRAHRACGQHVGTGFISSRNCLFRELNRGIEWLFTNDALQMQALLDGVHDGQLDE